MRWMAAVIVVLALAACSRPIQYARTEKFQTVFAAEEAAAVRRAQARCSRNWGLLFPGLAQLCTGKPDEGVALIALGVSLLWAPVAWPLIREWLEHRRQNAH